MLNKPEKPYFIVSLMLHLVLLLGFIISFQWSQPVAVIQNSATKDVIQAVVLGDTSKSHILPRDVAAPQPPPPTMKSTPKPPPPTPTNKPVVAQKTETVIVKQKPNKAIALKKPQPKKTVKPNPFKASDLLADIKQQTKHQKRQQQMALKKHFDKTLKQQAEETLRQQLLEEDLRLKAAKERQAQGEINKYKTLILQAISENWVVPLQADKKLYSELLIRLLPTGEVISVTVTKSSGDPALDSSARVAVLKSSPLPVPHDPDAFAAFKRFVLKVKPENIVNSVS